MKTSLQRCRRIACLGEVMVELVAGSGDSAAIGVAGDTYNTALYLRRLLGDADRAVDYLTALGDDALSDRILDHMRAHRIGTDRVARVPGGTCGLYAISTDDKGERSFSYWRGQSAARQLFGRDCALGLDALGDYDLIVLSAISVAILPPAVRAALFAALQVRRRAGATVVFDSNWRAQLWERVETARQAVADAWRLCDIALPSLDDEMALFGDADEAAVLARLAGYGLSDGVLKRGARGPLALCGARATGPFEPAPAVIDSTAAGDSFNAAYLAARLLGRGQGAALSAGHRLATAVVQARGAIIDTSNFRL